MSAIDTFKNWITGNDEEETDDYINDAPEFVNNNTSNVFVEEPQDGNTRRNKVVNINATTQLQMFLVKAERFEDASTVADHLNSKHAVVLNLEFTNKDVARRLVDFLSGVTYANNGQIKRVANNLFVITPYNVDIVGDVLDELENNGAFF